jgi:hypothetical protein
LSKKKHFLVFALDGLMNDKQVVITAAWQNPGSLRCAADTRAMALGTGQGKKYFDFLQSTTQGARSNCSLLFREMGSP